MKYFLIVLLFPFCVHGQTVGELKKMISDSVPMVADRAALSKVVSDSTALASQTALRKLANDSTATSGFETRGKFKNDSTVLAAATALKANTASPVFTGIATIPSIKHGRRAVADLAATLATSDYLLSYTSISATRAVTLPTAASTPNQFFIIKDESGSASVTNTITIVGTVDNAVNPTAINTARGVYRLFSNGTTWFTW